MRKRSSCVAITLLTACMPLHRGSPSPWYAASSDGTPRPLLAGRVRTVNGISVTRDGNVVFTSQWIDARDARGRRRVRIVERRWLGDSLSDPRAVSFGSAFNDYQPVLSPDGRRLYFNSTRPIPGDSAEALHHIWYVDRHGDGWTEPRYAAALNSAARDGYVALQDNGDVYFMSQRLGGGDFYVTRETTAGFAPPQPVTDLNTADHENDLVVARNGAFVVFNRYSEADQRVRMYAARRRASGWSTPIELTALNGTTWPLSPAVSPDGRYLLFAWNEVVHSIDLRALGLP